MGTQRLGVAPKFSWNRERRWIVWLLILIGSITLISFAFSRLSAQTTETEAPERSNTASDTGNTGLLFLAGFILFLVAAVFLALGLHWRFSGWPRIRDAQIRADTEYRSRWDLASRLFRELSAGQPLIPVDPGPVLPRTGEIFHIHAEVGYSRLVTAGDGSYGHAVAAGTGPAGIALLAGSLIGNSRRRSAAMAAATPAWREHQQTRVLAGNYGLIAFPYGRMMHFDWTAITAFYPAPDSWSATFEFATAEPLTIYGPSAPLIAVYAASRLWDEHRFRTSPEMQPVAQASTSPPQHAPGFPGQ